MLKVSQLQYCYQKENFNFELSIEQGSINAILGPSGSGKSTLLALLAGFIAPKNGDITVNETSLLNMPPHKRPFSMLFQEHNLFSHLSVKENIGLGLDPGLKLTAQQLTEIEKAAEQVGIKTLLSRTPDELSGGQRQRVALARCFVQSNPIWLLDEPFSALDPILREEMLVLVEQLVNERNITVLMVTHNVSDAKAIATDFTLIDKGEVQVADSIELLTSKHSNLLIGQFIAAGEHISIPK